MAFPACHIPHLAQRAFGGARRRSEVHNTFDSYMNFWLGIDTIITHVPSFDEFNQGFDLTRKGGSNRPRVH